MKNKMHIDDRWEIEIDFELLKEIESILIKNKQNVCKQIFIIG